MVDITLGHQREATVNESTVYDLHWKSIPMGAIRNHEDWYYPYLGSGVYMLVVATTNNGYVGIYVGQSKDIGRRWTEHVFSWFVCPDEKYWIAENAEEFLDDPVAVINNARLRQGLPNRREIQRRILDRTWFAFAEVGPLQSGHRLEDLEYVLQEELKKHAGIRRGGEIGDAWNRHPPTSELRIHSHFGRDFLRSTLPGDICFKP